MKQAMDVTLEGAIDLHVHPAPCLFQRPYDDIEVAKMCAAAGMRAILLKNHYEFTMSRAYYVNKAVPDIQVFGGVVLNRSVGGLNPLAVAYALGMGAKQIWMPNVDAAAHAEAYGTIGTYGTLVASLKPVKMLNQMISGKGISILDGGKIKQEVKDIVKLAIDFDAVLGSCHLFPKEIYELAKYYKSEGGKKLLITHPHHNPPNLKLQELKELVDLGGTVELCGACYQAPPPATTPINMAVEVIRTYGAKSCILSSDTGSAPFSAPHETLRVFAQWLFDSGITKEELRIMMIENQKKLLNLS